MAENPEINKIYLSGTPAEIRSNITNAYSSYLLQKLSEQSVIGGGSTPRELAPKRRGKLKINLFFYEPFDQVDPEYDPIEASTSFRLMNDDPATITLQRVQTLATTIKAKFDTNFRWHKGKAMCTYSDWDKGYQLQILAIDETEGYRIVEQVLDIQGHSPEPEFFNFTKNKAPITRYPTIPEKEIILGTSVRTDRQRPIGKVKFHSASIFVPKIKRTFTILDSSGQILKELKVGNRAG